MADRLRLLLVPTLTFSIVATIWSMAWLKQIQAATVRVRQPSGAYNSAQQREAVSSANSPGELDAR